LKPVRLVQFTDTHLFADPAARLCGIATSDSLDKVLALARLNGWPPDAILATGDLSQDGTPESYAHFVRVFDGLGPAVHCLPGNHDIPGILAAAVKGARTVHAGRRFEAGDWQVILLDSVIPNDNSGELADGELEFLDRALSSDARRHALICQHHNPVPVGSAWLDEMRLRNADAFFRVIDRHPHVRAVLCGHVHQEFESERRGVRLLATPSTCLQFLPGSEPFMLDVRPPGYRRLTLHPDGRIDTEVKRLSTYVFTPDLTMRGY
jgi:3',5'-cyclic-AMP phosphodiesterase